jgi:hypothetical protein
MGSITTLLSILRVYGTLRFTQIRHHLLYNPALCGPLVGRSRLRVKVKCDAIIRGSQKLLYRLHIFSVRLQDRAEGMTEGVPADE